MIIACVFAKCSAFTLINSRAQVVVLSYYCSICYDLDGCKKDLNLDTYFLVDLDVNFPHEHIHFLWC